jgi:uncharacterized repeat protein (TIGR03803 family)
MLNIRFSIVLRGILSTIAVGLALLTTASAGVSEQMFSLDLKGGAYPEAGVIRDGDGNLYGTTTSGGAGRAGTVFELTLRPNGGSYETVLYNFSPGADGAKPVAGLIFDASGNLYGTTFGGGNSACTEFSPPGCGTVFELSPNSGSGWSETVLYAFAGGSDGAYPSGGLIFDNAGNLYGTTEAGGNNKPLWCTTDGCGVVFELSPAGNGQWTEKVLHSFASGNDGWEPASSLVFDRKGNLFGTTLNGGSSTCGGGGGCGTSFEVKHDGNGKWSETVLHSFNGADGIAPDSALIFDNVGNLYGTTLNGGNSECGCGTLFELMPGANGQWTESILHSFNGVNAIGGDGEYPHGPTFDSAGNLFGTTEFSSLANGAATVFELQPIANGQWTEEVYALPLATLSYAGVMLDGKGNLYGTGFLGGDLGYGGVFQLGHSAEN